MGADTATPRVFTMPPGARFLDVLADAVLAGTLVPGSGPTADPLALADTTIFLPTRRACRALEAVFIARSPHGALLLPRIAPLGDVDEDDEAFLEDDGLGVDLPPPLSPLERQLTLARLVRAWAEAVADTLARQAPDTIPVTPRAPADALALAADLGALIDSVETEEADWNAFSRLVPEEYDEAWRITAEFLRIAISQWPEHLRELGRCDPAWRRSRALRALSKEFHAHPPKGPVIAAGSTGSIPATAALLSAIARLPKGAVVLPGLDLALDDTAWRLLAEDTEARQFTHPQRGLARLLKALDVQRSDVIPLGMPPAPERVRLLSTALRPAETTDQWAKTPFTPEQAEAALAGLALVEGANEREEALVVATIVRETLETPGRTVAVITPDRACARRVAGELTRWGIEAEDSAGKPLIATEAGVFTRLVLAASESDLAPFDLLALLKHPLARFGHEAPALRRMVEQFEIACLRGPAPGPGLAGLHEAIAACDHIDHDTRQQMQALADATGHALAPLQIMGAAPLGAWAARLKLALKEAASEPGEAALSAGLAPVLAVLDEIAKVDPAYPIARADAAPVFATLLGGQSARPQMPGTGRVAILGLLEARLIGADRFILAGLNEGIWPPETRNDPWLSRPMRREVGLPPPERRIGLAAHDFAQALAHPDVVVTRSLKTGGVPATMARWLQRIAAVTGPEAWRMITQRGEALLATARLLDDAPYLCPVSAPAPKPALHLRPDRLSVTQIETLLRDPYAIYARKILKLNPLDPVAMEPGAADRGTVIHDVVANFVAAGIDPAAPDARDRLIALGRAAFAALPDTPQVKAFWWARFERAADWFLGFERRRRPYVAASHVERKGELVWTTAANRRFMLTGRADRIDRLTHGGYAVLDYKTGQLPGVDETAANFAPQLPLEAAMLEMGAFEDIPPGPATSLVYVRLSGGTLPGEEREVGQPKDGRSAQRLGQDMLAELKKLIDRFEDENTPYTSRDHPKFRRRPNGDYDHLARVREWSLGADEGGEA